ncbi:MAG: DNA glycosylase [Verrucomicrobiota bacterium]
METTAWRPLEPRLAMTEAVLAELLDGGQAFRWNRQDGYWEGVWSNYRVRLRSNGGRLEAVNPAETAAETVSALDRYLAIERDWPAIMDALPWRSDAVLAAAIENWPGLRILRQPFGETLLCFLCSSTKQIVQIKQLCQALALHCGSPIDAQTAALPTWAQLHALSEDELRALKLGYRARYLKQTAAALAERPESWLNDVAALPYAEAKAELVVLPGVGEKIADCALLFGAGKLEAFPVDTWVLKSMARLYGLEGWSPSNVAQFGRVHFGPYAGVAQQVLFASERATSRAESARSRSPQVHQ